MALNMKEFSKKEKNGEKEIISGLMDLFFRVIGLKIILREKENTNGLMAEYIMENGKTINYMVKVYIHGQMEGDMKVNMKMIKSMDSEHTTGPMENLMKGNGKMENNMEKLDLQIQKVKVNMDYGKTEIELSGLMAKAQSKQEVKCLNWKAKWRYNQNVTNQMLMKILITEQLQSNEFT